MRLILFMLLIPSLCFATERDYADKFCTEKNGISEFVLSDKSRVDCLTGGIAWEVEFAKKWQEAIGQSLYYGIVTHRTPGIAVIAGEKDGRYLKRLKVIADEYGIKLEVIAR